MSAYWRPVYKYLRARWRLSAEQAEDLTQEFFARAFEQRFLDHYDPAKARFRTWLRLGLDRLAANEMKASQRLKRGGGATMMSIDFMSAEGEVREIEIAADSDLDAWFQQEFPCSAARSRPSRGSIERVGGKPTSRCSRRAILPISTRPIGRHTKRWPTPAGGRSTT